MPALSAPSAAVKASFLAAMAEFAAEGRGRPDDETMVGNEIRRFGEIWHTDDGFDQLVASPRHDADPGAERPVDRVPCTTWWWTDGEEYLGRIALRHRLNARLAVSGGHIGYDVRPTARRRGHATAMLAAVLPEARRRGITDALLTCQSVNLASRRVIEANGGRFEAEADGLLRFWVPTG